MNWDDLEVNISNHCRKGGKTSRRRQVARLRQFIKFCKGRGVKGPDQIGNRHVYEWYESGALSETTLRDRFYAVCKLWEWLERGVPPHHSLFESKKGEVRRNTNKKSSSDENRSFSP